MVNNNVEVEFTKITNGTNETKYEYEIISETVNYRKLMETQNSLNKYINKKIGNTDEWYFVRTDYDFLNAILSETLELLDSYPWAWWKKNKNPAPDTRNIILEFSDILHFSLSYDILQFVKYFSGKKISNGTELSEFKIFERIPDELKIFYSKKISLSEDEKIYRENNYEGIYYLLKILLNKFFKNYDREKNTSEEKFTKRLLVEKLFTPVVFSIAWNYFQIKPHDLENIFYLKNELNKIRQQFGYKHGNYPKIINGKEDNEILLDLYFKYGNRTRAVSEFKRILFEEINKKTQNLKTNKQIHGGRNYDRKKYHKNKK